MIYPTQPPSSRVKLPGLFILWVGKRAITHSNNSPIIERPERFTDRSPADPCETDYMSILGAQTPNNPSETRDNYSTRCAPACLCLVQKIELYSQMGIKTHCALIICTCHMFAQDIYMTQQWIVPRKEMSKIDVGSLPTSTIDNWGNPLCHLQDV